MNLQYAEIQAVLDSIDVATIIFRENQIRFANQAARRWAKRPDSMPQKQVLWDWIHPQSQRFSFTIYRDILNAELPQRPFEICLQHPLRGQVWVKASVKSAPYLDDKSWVVSFVELNDENSNLSDSQKTRDQHSQITIATNPTLSELISKHRLTDNMLEQFLDTVQEIIPCESSSLALIRNDLLEFIALRGKLEGLELSQLTHELNVAKTPKTIQFAMEAEHGRVQLVDDVQKEPNWIPIEGTEYIRSWMGILLYFEGEVIGLLNLEHSSPNFFNEEHARMALSLARQASQAIVYTRLYQQMELDIQERERLQEILMQNLIATEIMYASQQILASSLNLSEALPKILNILSSSISMGNTQIFLVVFDESEEKLLYYLKSDDCEEDIWSIYKSIIAQPQLPEYIMPAQEFLKFNNILRLADARQVLASTINTRGMLFALREKGEHPFNELDKEVIITVAHQITVAVENELLDAQVQQYTQQLERLVEKRTFQLSVEQKRLQAILDATAEGIFYTENFLFQYTNPAFCRMVGYSFDELYGKPISFVRIINDDDEPHNFNALLDNPVNFEQSRSETRLRHRDGTEFYANIRYSLIGKPNESPIRMVAVARDISQERQLYIQRARFIANAAHELRTPLSSLILRLHLLRRQPEKMDDHLNSLDQVTVYLRELVEQLLDLSRFERGRIILERNNFVLQKLIQQAIAEHTPFAAEQHVRLELDLPEEPVEIRADGTRILQMMSNLIANGINYNHVDGTVWVKMSVEKDVVGNRNAIIEVKDNGIGIEADLLPNEIFEPFSRPSAGNRRETGMGLALVREIAVLHEGTVHVRSTLDEGSVFRVSLPLD